MKLKLAKSKTAYQAAAAANGTFTAGYLNHGTKVLKQLVEPCTVKGYRVVAADSYFASMESAKQLEEMGLGLIALVKQASHQHIMAHLQSKSFTCRGNCYVLGYPIQDPQHEIPLRKYRMRLLV